MSALFDVPDRVLYGGPARWHCACCGRFVAGRTVESVRAPWEWEAPCSRCGISPVAVAPR